MQVILHRGIDHIGGCITEIQSASGARIFIDLGHLLPEGDKPAEDKLANRQAIEELTRGASAVLYTHNHGDHVELFDMVPDTIPQYIGHLAAELMQLKLSRLSNLKEQHDACVEKIGKLSGFRHYKENESFRIADFTITPYFVSHSATDSYMLKVQCDGKTLLHTGDFREHGYLGKGLRPALNRFNIAQNVDILIIEGTNVDQINKPVKSEWDIRKAFEKIIASRKNVFIFCSSMDADRLESIYSANYRKLRPWKTLVCDKYQEKVMLTIEESTRGKGPLYKFRDYPIYTLEYNLDRNKRLLESMEKKGFTMLIRKSDTYSRWLERILPFCKKEETSFVYSMYRGYVEEGMGGFSKETFDFIQPLVDKSTPVLDPKSKYDYNHTSGHASMQSLKEICEIIAPKTAIIPIHKSPEADYHSLGLPKELEGKIVEEDTYIDDIYITINRNLA